jgi:acetylornithine deacetylase/succinyl-diaminopimelate desuccinylase-like protein
LTSEAGVRSADLLPAARARVEERFAADLERIRDYLRMPSVSATGEGIREVAHATAGWIADAGGRAEVVETAGHPLVLGEISGPPGSPRLLRYGMYDVQPAEEPDWTSPPFAAEVREMEGVGPAVVARGSANSKGSLASFFVAVEVLRELDSLPVSLALMIEGEEELGSPNLEAAAAAYREDLAAEAAFDLELTAGLDGRPELITGCKGLLTLELSVEGGDWGGPAIPLHSSEEAWIASPAWALVHALASLTDAGEGVLVEGFHDAAIPPTEEDEDALRTLAERFDLDLHLRQARASRYRLSGGAQDLLRALIFRPTLNINGLHSGYVGPGGKTIIPHEARAVVDIRLVPDMDAETMAETVRKHLAARGFGHVGTRVLESYPWAKARPDNAVARAIAASYERLGVRFLPYPMAPWCAPYFVFDRLFGVPWASGGIGHAAGAHGPDEYAAVDGLKEHIVGAIAFLLAYPGVRGRANAGVG